MQIFAIFLACIIVYVGCYVKKWYGVAAVFTIILVLYCGAYFGYEKHRTLQTDWLAEAKNQDVEDLYVVVGRTDVRFLADGVWCSLKELEEMEYWKLQWWVKVDGKTIKVEDSAVKDFLIGVTEEVVYD